MLSRSLLLVATAVAALVSSGCEQVPLLAPTASTISVSASTRTLPTGGSTEVSALVMEAAGTPVHNGTVVRFSASLGSVDPVEVETRGGIATTTFIAGAASGTAQIRATSGGATGGTGTTPTNVLEILIGGAATNAVTVTASPSTLPSTGGTSTITASAVDASGNRIAGVPVTFTTTAGNLSAQTANSDANGEARVTVTTTRTADVTARAGGKESKATVTVGSTASVALSVSPASPRAGETVTLTVTPTIPTGGQAPRVVVTWGDGAQSDLGTVATPRTATHAYNSAGSYVITAISTAEGETSSSSTTVTVNAPGPVALNVTASNPTPARCSPVTFTATATLPTGDTTPIARYEWAISSNVASENETTQTTGNQLTRVFRTAGTKTITVTAVTSDGRTSVAQTQIVVRELTGTEVCS
jgi:adhesin/invasin